MSNMYGMLGLVLHISISYVTSMAYCRPTERFSLTVKVEKV